jgi:apolipoprotein D and lipocalin family protein
VTAKYSLLEHGGVEVINRGYLSGKDQWKEAQGKTYFVNSNDEG